METAIFRVSAPGIKNQCYLAYSGGEGVLIDPAFDEALISSFLTGRGITLRGILLTHAHPDHTDLAALYALRYGVPVYLSAAEIAHTGFSCPNLLPAVHQQQLLLGGLAFTCLLTPGHTPGSMCFLGGKHCFTGDTVFMEGVGICDREGAGQLFDAVQLLKNTLDEDTQVWPGHSFGREAGGSMAALLKTNMYFWFREKEKFVDFRMRKNRPDPFAFK